METVDLPEAAADPVSSSWLEQCAAAADRAAIFPYGYDTAAALDACNAVFGRIMSPALGEIEYNEEASLVRSGSFSPEGEMPPELVVIDPASPDEEETPDKTMTEARYVARRIRAMVEAHREYLSEKGILPAET